MKILITGGCGFVGSNIAIYLKKKFSRININSLDNLSRRGSSVNLNRLKKQNIKNYSYDISNYKKLKKLPKYTFFRKIGPQHSPIFKTEVEIPESIKITGSGSSKKKAQQNAAEKLIKILNI